MGTASDHEGGEESPAVASLNQLNRRDTKPLFLDFGSSVSDVSALHRHPASYLKQALWVTTDVVYR